ncbi:ABC transporter G family member 23 [Forsythia ovata]|uniref:ABC transporter G family member 23 n=1 Tax=Forsythia ovata TaxID=205694 RepID=A0ABD1WXY1_9LAMI
MALCFQPPRPSLEEDSVVLFSKSGSPEESTTIVGGFGLGSVYIKVRNDEGGVAERLGLFEFSLSFLLSSTVEALPIYLQERHVMMKEASRRAYNISSYPLDSLLTNEYWSERNECLSRNVDQSECMLTGGDVLKS